MTDEKIENILRKAPRPGPPDGLLETLQRSISLPRAKREAVTRSDSGSWVRRWFPALGFAVVFLSCVVVLAVQTREIASLREQTRSLQANLEDLPELRRDNAGYQRLLLENQELERLRKDAQEVQALRAEVAQLRAQVQEMTRLRAENQQLAAGGLPVQRGEPDAEFFARVGSPGDKAKSIQCVNNLKQIGLAARIWATGNNDVLPPDWLAMSKELATPKILACPGDTVRTAAPDWASFSAASVSYEFLNPNGSETEPQVVLARCPIHGHVCLSDGSVHQLGKNRALIMKDGKYVLSDVIQDPFANYTELMRRRYGLLPGANLTAPQQSPTNLNMRYGLTPPGPNKP